jgi:cysteine desulfurase
VTVPQQADSPPRRSYLDANATEPLRPEAREATLAALAVPGNPSSVHAEGRAARRLLETARERLGETLGVRPASITFTAGGTEANALALAGFAAAGRRVLVSATEHDAVRRAVATAGTVPVDADGVISLAALAEMLAADARPAVVALMLANNETGTLQPLAEAAAICRAAGALLHVDAVQGPGRVGLAEAVGLADTLALSGHKAGGPKGAGALVVPGEAQPLPLIRGGGQERGLRGGTEALPAIAGLAAAVAAAEAWRQAGGARRLAALKARIVAALPTLAPTARVVAAGVDTLPNTLCLALPGAAAATQVMALDLAGIAVSAGSACSSGKVAESHVLAAMDLGALAGEAIRVSLPWNAAEAEVDAFLAAYGAMAARLARRAA